MTNNIVISQPDDMQFVTVTVGIKQQNQVQKAPKNKQMVTVVVGFAEGSAAYQRAVELDTISKEHVNDARKCVSMMSGQYSNLAGKVEQISFYLDTKNNRGVYSGIASTESVMAAGGAKELSKQVIAETSLSVENDLSDIQGYSWVFFALDGLDDGSGNLSVTHSNGSVGGS